MKKYLPYIIIVTLAVALVISVLYNSGMGVEIDEDIVTYEEFQKKITEKQDELTDITLELEDNRDYYNEVIELAQEHEKLMDIAIDYRIEISSLESEIEEKQNELDKISGEVAKVKGEPIKINPGVYHFGEDIETGRYKLKAQKGNNGNVFFRGENNFGETFGIGEYRIEEYTFYAEDGDELEASIPILLFPVE